MAENNENILTRVVPHSQEAEQSVIGAMLRDKDAVSTAAEMLRPEDFYQKQYSLMFDAMTQLYQKDQPVDLVTLSEKLKATSNIPPEVYDIAVIRDIVMSAPSWRRSRFAVRSSGRTKISQICGTAARSPRIRS